MGGGTFGWKKWGGEPQGSQSAPNSKVVPQTTRPLRESKRVYFQGYRSEKLGTCGRPIMIIG